VDIIIDDTRVVVADAVWLTEDDQRKQEDATAKAGRKDSSRTRILIPPTLVIESISPGHERHDERTKLKWYAEFGVPN
jgi:Uma2 family endonuclease